MNLIPDVHRSARALLCLSLSILGNTALLNAEEVNIPDPNLAALIRSSLAISDGTPITTEAMATLDTLKYSGKGRPQGELIQDLEGLQHATNLTSLNLQRNRIASISQLSALSQLEVINLYSNKELDDISVVSGLTSLKQISVGSCNISDLSPIAGLTQLQILDIQGNPATDSTPIHNLTNLTRLTLGTGDDAGSIADISFLSEFSKLTNFSAAKSNITGISSLAGNTGMDYLNLNNNSISEISVVSGMPGLRYLYFDNNNVSDISPVANLTDLLEIAYSNYTVQSHDPLTNLSKLKNVWFSGTGATSISHLADKPDLNYVNIQNNSIGDLTPIQGSTKIQFLYIRNNQVTDIAPVQNMSELRTFLAENNQIPDLAPLAGKLSLRDVRLNNNLVTDASPLGSCPDLWRIWLNNNQLTKLGDFSQLTNLDELSISNNQLTDISTLGHCTKLTELYAQHNQISNVGDLSGLTILRTINLESNQITSLDSLATATNLTYLRFPHNQVTSIGFVGNLSKLQFLHGSNNKIQEFALPSSPQDLQEIYMAKNVIRGGISLPDGLSKVREFYFNGNYLTSIGNLDSLSAIAFKSDDVYIPNNYLDISDGSDVVNYASEALERDPDQDPDVIYQPQFDPNGDRDQDGMHDGWEIANMTDPVVHDAGEDPDGDHYSNIEEYEAQTSPVDPASFPTFPPTAIFLSNNLAPENTSGATTFGHLYAQDIDSAGGFEPIEGEFSWQEARDDAPNQGGYLATVISNIEHRLVLASIPSTQAGSQYWLGGTDEETEGTWLWITGEPWGYEAWGGTEPNGGTGENHIELTRAGEDGSRGWNDEFPPARQGYILEKNPAFALVQGEGADNNSIFQIQGNALQITQAQDFEAGSGPFSVRVQVTDRHGLTYEQSLQIGISDVNEPSTGITLSTTQTPEDRPVGSLVAILITSDPDQNDTFTYSLARGQGDKDNSFFSIEGNQLNAAKILDRETQEFYSVRLRSTDAAGNETEAGFVIEALDMPENSEPTGITISATSADENLPAGTEVATLHASDDETQIFTGGIGTFSLVNKRGATYASATIDAERKSGHLAVITSQAEWDIMVKQVSLQNLLGLRILLGASDAEEEGKWTWVTDEQFEFNIWDNGQPDNFTGKEHYLEIFDRNHGANPVSGLKWNDVDDLAVLHDYYLLEQPLTYELAEGRGDTDNHRYTLLGNRLLVQEPANFEESSSHSIRVKVTDVGGLSYEESFTITIKDGPDAPMGITLSKNQVAENLPLKTVIGKLSTIDADALEKHTYKILNDTRDFLILRDELVTFKALDFEAKPSHTLSIQVSDRKKLTYTQDITIEVLDANDTPTALALSANTVVENAPTGTEIGTFIATDPDEGDTHTYKLAKSTDSAYFRIVGDKLNTLKPIDFEATPTLEITVTVSDKRKASLDVPFTIEVQDANDAPTGISISTTTFPENLAPGQEVLTFSTTDQDPAFELIQDSFTWSNASLDAEEKGGHLATFSTRDEWNSMVAGIGLSNLAFRDIWLGASDEGNEGSWTWVDGTPLSYTRWASPNKTEGIDEQPPNNLGEGEHHLALSGLTRTLLSWDDMPGETALGAYLLEKPTSYKLVSGKGDTQNHQFKIVGNSLQMVEPADFEGNTRYSILVEATDPGGLTYQKSFALTVTDAPDTPTAISLSPPSVPENQLKGYHAATLSANDQDAGEKFTFKLTEPAEGNDNQFFYIVRERLHTNQPFDYEARSEYSIQVEVSDKDRLTFTQDLALTIADANDIPTAISIDNNILPENEPGNTAIGKLSATDPDPNERHFFNVIGGKDQALAYMRGDTLFSRQPVNYEQKPTLDLVIEVSDIAKGKASFPLTIQVANANDAPTGVTLGNDTLSENLPSMLVSWWKMDGSGEDSGPGNNHGTLVGNAFFEPGREGQALRLDGNGDSLSIPSFTGGKGMSSLTVSAWTFLDNLPSGDRGDGDIFVSDRAHTHSPNGVVLWVNYGPNQETASFSNALSLSVGSTGMLANRVNSASNVLKAGEWQHMVGVFDGTTRQVYVNGQLSATFSEDSAVSTISLDGIPVDIGGGVSLDHDFEGLIDDVRVYSAALTPLQIEKLHAGILTPDKTPTYPESAVTPTSFGPLSLVDEDRTQIKKIAAGVHTLFLMDDGSVWTMGANEKGQLGTGDNAVRVAPVQIFSSGVKDIAAGSEHSLVAMADGSVWAFGDNGKGQLGKGDNQNSNVPVMVIGEGVSSVYAGSRHSLAIKSDGSLWAFGWNENGQVGDGTFEDRNAPVQILDGGIMQVAAMGDHTAVVKSDGSLWTFGKNDDGQLGLGDTQNRNVPTQVVDKAVTSVAAGGVHILFTKEGGSLWAMGANQNGQLGTGDNNESLVPVKVEDADVIFIEARNIHSLFIKTGGSLWGMGWNGHGQLGDGSTQDHNAPVQIVGGGVAIAEVGVSHSIYVMDDGSMWGMGKNSEGELGDGTTTDRHTPVELFTLSPTFELVPGRGDDHNHLFTIDGNRVVPTNPLNFEANLSYSVRIKGTDIGGLSFEDTLTLHNTDAPDAPDAIQLSNHTLDENSAAGTTVGTLKALDEDAKDSHVVVLLEGAAAEGADNALFEIKPSRGGATLVTGKDAQFDFETAAVYNLLLQATDKTGHSVTQPLQVNILDVNDPPHGLTISTNLLPENEPKNTVVGTLAAEDQDPNERHTYKVVGGKDAHLFIAKGTTLSTLGPADFEAKQHLDIIVEVTDIARATARFPLTIQVTDVNDVPTGIEFPAASVPENQPAGTSLGSLAIIDAEKSKIVKATAGGHSLFLLSDGSLWSMGGNSDGQLGDGTTTARTEPYRVFETGVIDVAAGIAHTLCVKIDGSLWGFGSNGDGQLGDGTNGNKSTPVQILSEGVKACFIGADHSLIIKHDGSLWTFGQNSNGQLGDGTRTNRNIPVKVMDSGAVAAAAKGSHSLAIKEDGSLWTFGSGSRGGNGDGSNKDLLVPTKIVDSGVISIGAGASHSLFVKDDGSLWGMGNNSSGQLGDGTGQNQSVPVEIVGSGVVYAEARAQHSVFIKDDGSLWTMGSNSSGQLGLGDTTNRNVPGMAMESGVVYATCGVSHTLFIKEDGSLWGMGKNSAGELGDGTTTNRHSPISLRIVQPVYELVPGKGDVDNHRFTVQGNQLIASEAFDFETQASLSIRVKATDLGGLWTEKVFVIAVEDQPDAPTAVALDNHTLGENSKPGVEVGYFHATDQDQGEKHSFALVDPVDPQVTNDNAAFTIFKGRGGVSLRTAEGSSFDYEDRNEYTIHVEVTDKDGLSYVQPVLVKILDANDLPLTVSIDTTHFLENQPKGTLIGSLSATDPDADETFTYAVAGGEDGDYAYAQKGNLYANLPADFETQGTLDLVIEVTDSARESAKLPLSITLLDANDAPTAVLADASTILENLPAGTVVATLSLEDPDNREGTDDAGVGEPAQGTPGKKIWESSAQDRIFSSAAISGDGLVYIGSRDNSLYALDANTGDRVWEFATGGAVYSTPAFGPGNVLYFGSGDGNLYALDASTGEVIWESAIGYVFSAPVIGASNQVIVGTVEGSLLAVDARTGRKGWEFKTGGSIKSSPTLGPDGLVYIGSADMNLYAVSSLNGKRKWAFTTGGAVESSVATASGLVYFGSADGNVYALDDHTGEEVWKFDTGTIVSSSPAIGMDGTVYIGSRNSSLYAFDGITGEIKWSFVSGGAIFASPVIGSGGIVYIASRDNNLYALDGATGEKLWEFSAGGPISSSPAIGPDGTIYIGSDDNKFYAVLGNQGNSPATWPVFGQNYQRTGKGVTFSLILGKGDNAGDFFGIVGDKLLAKVPLDYETLNNFDLQVKGTDSGGLSTVSNLEILVLDAPEAPAGLVLEPGSIPENSKPGTSAGSFVVGDQDAGEKHVITLVEGEDAEGTDNALFEIVESRGRATLVTTEAGSHDHEARDRYQLLAQVQDKDGNLVVFGVTVAVSDINEPPIGLTVSPPVAMENQPAGSLIGTLAGLDPDDGQTHTFTIRGGRDAKRVYIEGDKLYAVGTFDYESLPSLEFSVRVQDPFRLSKDFELDIPVVDSADFPEDILLDNQSLAENLPAGSLIGSFSLDDPDSQGYMAGDPSGGDLPDPGTLKWKFETGDKVRSSAVIGEDGKIYFGSRDHKAYALDAATGELVWEFETEAFIYGSPSLGLDGTLVIPSTDGKLYALDSQTGEQKWSTALGYMETAPTLGAFGRVFVGTQEGKVHALDITSGNVLWEFTTGGAVYSSPALGTGGRLYVGSLDKKVYCLDSVTGQKVWEFQTDGEIYSSPAVGSGGFLYIGSLDGFLYSLKEENGELAWKADAGSEIRTSPAVDVDGTIYIGTKLSQVTAFEGTSGAQKWSTFTSGDLRSSPVIGAGGSLYIGSTNSHLYALDKNTGEELWKFKSGGIIHTVPAIAADGTIYFGTHDNKLYAIHGVAGEAPWPMLGQNNKRSGKGPTFQLVDGEGSEDNSNFQIIGQQLYSTASLDYEEKPGYSIKVRGTDPSGLPLDKTFVIRATDQGEAPTGIQLAPNLVPENSNAGTDIGVLTVLDPDQGDTHTLALVSGNGGDDNDYFNLSKGRSGITLETAPDVTFDFESKPVYDLLVQATDKDGLTYEQTLQVFLQDVNDSPSKIFLTNHYVQENQRVNTEVGTLYTEDADLAEFTTILSDDFGTQEVGTSLSDDPARDWKGGLGTRWSLAQAALNPSRSNQLLSNVPGTDFVNTGRGVNLVSAQDFGDAIVTLEVMVAKGGNTGVYMNGSYEVQIFDSFGKGTLDASDMGAVFGVAPPTANASLQPGEWQTLEIHFTAPRFSAGLKTSNARFEKVLVNGQLVQEGVELDGPTGQGDPEVSKGPLVLQGTFGQVAYRNIRVRHPDEMPPMDWEGGLPEDWKLASVDTNPNKPSELLATIEGMDLVNVAAGADLVSKKEFGDAVIELEYMVAEGANSGVYVQGAYEIQLFDSFGVQTPSVQDNGAVFGVQAPSSNASLPSGEWQSLEIHFKAAQFADGQKTANARFDRVILNGQTIHSGIELGGPTGQGADESPLGPLVLQGKFGQVAFRNILVRAAGARPATFSIIGGKSAKLFNVKKDKLVTAAAFDFEDANEFEIIVEGKDSKGASVRQTLNLYASNANEVPTDIVLDTLSIPENIDPGTLLANLSTLDADPIEGIGVYGLVKGNFTWAAAKLDAEARGGHLATVTSSAEWAKVLELPDVTDAKYWLGGTDEEEEGNWKWITGEPWLYAPWSNGEPNDAGSGEHYLTTWADNTGEAGSVNGFWNDLPQSGAAGYIIEYKHLFSLVDGRGGEDNANFILQGTQLFSQADLDFESKPAHNILIQVTDPGGLTFQKAVVLQVVDGPDAPTAILPTSLSIKEGTKPGAFLATLTAEDQDARDRHIFEYVDAPDGEISDNAYFKLSKGRLFTDTQYDYEAKKDYHLYIKATDLDGLTVVGKVTVSIENVNEPPTDLEISATTFEENLPSGTEVATFMVTDMDLDMTAFPMPSSFPAEDRAPIILLQGDAGLTLDLGTDFADPGASVQDYRGRDIASDNLEVTGSVDTSIAGIHTLSYDFTDPKGLSAKTVFRVVKVIDPDATILPADTYTYSLVKGDGSEDNSKFRIDSATGSLSTAASFDYETGAPLSIRVQVADAAGVSYQEAFTLSLLNANDAPTALAISPSDPVIEEAQPAGTLIGTLATTDIDSTDFDFGEEFTYELTAGDGDAQNANFQISGDQVLVKTPLVHIDTPVASFLITATDKAGATISKAFTVTVTDKNDAPTAISIDNASVQENLPFGSPVGNLSATDPDTGNTHTFALVSGSGSNGNDSFFIQNGNELVTNALLDFETKSSYSVRIQATDNAGATFADKLTISITDQANETGGFFLTVNSVPAGGGLTSGAGLYDDGETATLSATAGPGYTFAGWAGDLPEGTGSGATQMDVLMDSDKTLTAYFARQFHDVNVLVYPDRHGYAKGGGSVLSGTQVTVTAEELQGDDNVPFSHWRVNGVDLTDSTDTTLTLTVDSDLKVEAVFDIGLPDNFVHIPAGSFTRGYKTPDEHVANVSGFYMTTHEISKGEWYRVYNWAIKNGYSFDYNPQGVNGRNRAHNDPAYHDDFPITGITWIDMVKWCNARSEMEGWAPTSFTDDEHTTPIRFGNIATQEDSPRPTQVQWRTRGFRLPTETEWERAARGGKEYLDYPNGSTVDSNSAYFGNSSRARIRDIDFTTQSSRLPNGFGLYDMAGNAHEACWDWYSRAWYSTPDAQVLDNTGPTREQTGLGRNYRMARGGGGNSDSKRVMVHTRILQRTWLMYSITLRPVFPAPSTPDATIMLTSDQAHLGNLVGGGVYEVGTQATLTVTADSGAAFKEWQDADGNVLGTATTLQITADMDKTIQAVFEDTSGNPPFYTLRATAAPEGTGSVTGTGAYLAGSSVQVSATPAEGLDFAGWSGDAIGTEPTINVTILGTTKVVGAFGDTSIDSDRDGLSDLYEEIVGSNPFDSDSDSDGINDGDEVAVYSSDPTKSDSDGDGHDDRSESLYNTSLTDKDDFPFLPTASLVRHYPFRGNAIDYSGNRGKGTTKNVEDTDDRWEALKNAFRFNGSTAYMEEKTYFGVGGSSARAISGWVRTTLGNSGPVVSYGKAPSPFTISVNVDGSVEISTGDATLTGTTVIADDTWHQFIVSVPEGATPADIALYVDGQADTLTPTGDSSTELATSTRYPINVGRDALKNYFAGDVDEIRVWERWLHSAEASKLHDSEKYVEPDTIRPEISYSPVSTTVAVGDDVTFTVGAKAKPDPSYTWEKFENRKWVRIKGSGATLTLASVDEGDALNYRVTVTNSQGSATSRAARLTVLNKPAIDQAVQDTALLLGRGGKVFASVSGSPRISYEWFKDGASLGSSSSNSLFFPKDATQATHGGTYSYKASNDVGEITSAAFTISIIEGVEITSSPASTGILQGDPGSLAVSATGGGTLTYQWYKYDDKTRKYLAIDGATDPSLDIPSMSIKEAGKYNVTVSNGPSSETSRPVELDMYIAPTFKSHPRAGSINEGTIYTFTSEALGDPAPTYQWQRFNTGTTLWEDVPKQLKSSYNLGRVDRGDTGKYRVVATNAGGVATSNEVDVLVYYQPVLTTDLEHQTANEGEDVVFTVAADALDKRGTAITYKWINGRTEVLRDGNGITGTGTPTLTLTAVDKADIGTWYCLLTNTVGTTRSYTAKLTVIEKPYTTRPLADKTLAAGKRLALSAVVLGTKPMTYQWFKDGTAIRNANTTLLSFTSLRTSDAGEYSFEAENPAGKLTMTMTLTVTSGQVSGDRIVQGADILTDDADPDGDGLANLLEHALGSDPANPDSTYAPVVNIVQDGSGESFFSFQYTENKAATDVTTLVEQSADLKTWEPIDLNEAAVSTLDRGDLNQTSVYIPTSSGARFFRIRVEK